MLTHARLCAAAAVLLVLLGAPVPASARTLAEEGCLDVVGGSADYTASTGAVRVLADLAAPSCRWVDYALRVYDGTGTLATVSVRGSHDSSVLLSAAVPPAPSGSTVAVEVTTTGHEQVVDTAPDPAALDATTDQNQNGLLDVAELLDGAASSGLALR